MSSNISMDQESKQPEMISLGNDIVLIAGGGPVGLIVGTTLAHYGVKSIILERNNSTTKWPKMDLTNVRSMELLRKLGIAEDLRKIGVSSSTPYNVYMTSGLHNEKPITSWKFPSVDELRKQYQEKNDGTCPSEPWQRVSQAVFEKYLKERCDANPLIDCRFGWRVERTTESNEGVLVEVIESSTNRRVTFFSKYMVACDGASSRTRRDMEIPLDGGPVPGYALLVHFKSADLKRLFKFGTFWHYFVFNKEGLHAAAICQDDQEIFTTHLLLPLDADHESIDSKDAIYRSLGGMGQPYKVEVDEILVRSTYRHSIAVARTYRSSLGKIYLAGDSAHQNIPTGGYGMNLGIGDAFDISWKLAAVINGKAGERLLDSYEEERRPIAIRSIERSGEHMKAHMAVTELLAQDPYSVEKDSLEGHDLRRRIHDHYQKNNGENADIGIEMDHRHKSSVYPTSPESDEELAPWNPAHYTPNTSIGSRAPHVLLKDGNSIFDHYGLYWTLFQFSDHGKDETVPLSLLDAARKFDMPLKHVVLHGESHAHTIWGYRLVLVRADGHVAWRGQCQPETVVAEAIVLTISGRSEIDTKAGREVKTAPDAFSATSGIGTQVDDYKLEQMGVMQL